jgi:hypothetical protein
MKKERKIIQITASARGWGAVDDAAEESGGISAREVDNLCALCSDGTVWLYAIRYPSADGYWHLLPPIPQGKPE